MIRGFSNFGLSTLNMPGGFTIGGTSMTINSPASAEYKFPTSGKFPVVVSAVDASGVLTNPEVFLLTGAVGNTFVCVGGQEGTTQKNHANGEIVQMIISAAMLAEIFGPNYHQETGAGPYNFDGTFKKVGVLPAIAAAFAVSIVTAGLTLGNTYEIANEDANPSTLVTATPDAGVATPLKIPNGCVLHFYWNGTNIIPVALKPKFAQGYSQQTGAGPYNFNGAYTKVGINPVTPAPFTATIVTASLVKGDSYELVNESQDPTTVITATPDAGSSIPIPPIIIQAGGAIRFYWNGTDIIVNG